LEIFFVFKNILSFVAISLASSLFASAAQAHFQMVYTPDLLRERGGLINLKLPFTHPADSGYVMAVEPPEQFYVVKKGKKTDLLANIKTSTWTSAANTGDAYEVDATLRGLGDHVFVMQMAPYFEEAENVYIQQIVKTIVNVGTLPTDWNETLGLTAEIVPLTKPYGILAGGTFTGVVKSNGQPVPFAEIEVEYVNYDPDMKNNRFSDTANANLPSDLFITMTIYADANGTFTFGIPKAGQWGFAALGVGEKTELNGKELSQDAVIWVQAHDFKAVK
jgi:cobalt/nickel transport protein